jgi:hypothetical protein
VRRCVIALPLILSALQACSSTPTHFVESDVPIPADTKVRYSTELKRTDGKLTGGWFILWGEILDINKTTSETITRYSNDGWELVEERLLPKQADLRFAKDSRIVRVIIDARRIDPWSSSATVRVASSTDADASSAPADTVTTPPDASSG